MTTIFEYPGMLGMLVWGFPGAMVLALAWLIFWGWFVARERKRIADDRDYLKYGG